MLTHNKTVSLLLTLIAVSSFPLTGGAYSAVLENFDSLIAGTPLAGQDGWASIGNEDNAQVADGPLSPWTPPNYLNIFGGAGVEKTFTPTSLTNTVIGLAFHFMPNNTVEGGDLIATLNHGTGTEILYLQLSGNTDTPGLNIGTDSAHTTFFSFSEALESQQWYRFATAIDTMENTLDFFIIPASGGSPVISGSLEFSSAAASFDHITLQASSGVTSGQWSLDDLSLVVIPEAGTLALILGKLALLLVGAGRYVLRWKNNRRHAMEA